MYVTKLMYNIFKFKVKKKVCYLLFKSPCSLSLPRPIKMSANAHDVKVEYVNVFIL